jgi:hypothetical protein
MPRFKTVAWILRICSESMMISDKNDEWSVATEAQSGLKGWYQKSLSALRKPLFFILAIFVNQFCEL